MSHARAISAKPTSDLLYLDDLRVGRRFRSGTYTVTTDEIQIFAYEFDPQPFHSMSVRRATVCSAASRRAAGTRRRSR